MVVLVETRKSPRGAAMRGGCAMTHVTHAGKMAAQKE